MGRFKIGFGAEDLVLKLDPCSYYASRNCVLVARIPIQMFNLTGTNQVTHSNHGYFWDALLVWYFSLESGSFPATALVVRFGLYYFCCI